MSKKSKFLNCQRWDVKNNHLHIAYTKSPIQKRPYNMVVYYHIIWYTWDFLKYLFRFQKCSHGNSSTHMANRQLLRGLKIICGSYERIKNNLLCLGIGINVFPSLFNVELRSSLYFTNLLKLDIISFAAYKKLRSKKI